MIVDLIRWLIFVYYYSE